MMYADSDTDPRRGSWRLRSMVAAAGLVLSVAATPADAALVVVVAADNNVAKLSLVDVKAIFLGIKMRLPNGMEAVPVFQRELYDEFNQAVLGRPSEKVKRYWKRRLFSGVGTQSTSVADDAEVKAYMRETAGAIGYIDSESLDPGVKSLFLVP
jgi:ABC-type phosphate transport system substrate-binding protein